MTDLPPGTASLASQLGARGRLTDEGFLGWVDAEPRLCSHGTLRASVVAMVVDMAAGYTAETMAETDWNFTADLSVRVGAVAATRLEGIPIVQRAGRTISMDMPMHDPTGAPVAHGTATFTRVQRRPGDPPRPDFPVESVGAWDGGTVDPVAALEARDMAGGIEVDLREELCNPAGVLQGAVAALIAEIAGQRHIEARLGRPMVANALDVRYVSMGRVGPIRATVDPIGAASDHTLVVRLLDAGDGDRIVTHDIIGFVPAPGS